MQNYQNGLLVFSSFWDNWDVKFLTDLFALPIKKLKLKIHLVKAGSWNSVQDLILFWPNSYVHYKNSFSITWSLLFEDKIIKFNSKYLIEEQLILFFELWVGLILLILVLYLTTLEIFEAIVNCQSMFFSILKSLSYFRFGLAFTNDFNFKFQIKFQKKINFDNKTSSLLPIFWVSSTQHHDRSCKSRRFKGKFTCMLAL